jgi:hypothetical protein
MVGDRPSRKRSQKSGDDARIRAGWVLAWPEDVEEPQGHGVEAITVVEHRSVVFADELLEGVGRQRMRRHRLNFG